MSVELAPPSLRMPLGQALLSQRQAEDLNLKLAEGADDSGGWILIPSSDPRGPQVNVVTRKVVVGTPPTPLGVGAAGRGSTPMYPSASAPRSSRIVPPMVSPPARGASAMDANGFKQPLQSRKRTDGADSSGRSGGAAKRPKVAPKGKSTLTPMEHKECLKIVDHLIAHPKSYWFRAPVDAAMLPDYHTIIQQPMDLGTVKEKLEAGEYPTVMAFADDVHLIFANCKTYNQPGTDVYKKGEGLEAIFEKRFTALENKLEERAAAGGGGGGGEKRRASGARAGQADMMQQMQQMMAAGNPMAMMMQQMQQMMTANNPMAVMNPMAMMNPMMLMMGAGGGEQMQQMQQQMMQQMMQQVAGGGAAAAGGGGAGSANGAMPTGPANGAARGGGGGGGGGGGKAPAATKRAPAERGDMSFEELRQLTVQIGKLKPNQVAKVADIIRRESPHLIAQGDEVKLDLDSLESATQWKLQDYVNTCCSVNAKKKKAPITNAQRLEAAQAKRVGEQQKIAELQRRTGGTAPYVDPLMPRPGAAPTSTSRGAGSRKVPGFAPPPPMPSMPSKSASRTGPSKSVGMPTAGAAANDDSSSDSSDGGAPVPKPSLLGTGALPMPIGRGKTAASSGGTAGGLLGKTPLPNKAAWSNLARPQGGGAAAPPGASKAWGAAVAARQASAAQKDQV